VWLPRDLEKVTVGLISQGTYGGKPGEGHDATDGRSSMKHRKRDKGKGVSLEDWKEGEGGNVA